MEVTNLEFYRIEKDRIRENLNKYTRKAFGILPRLNNPQILDVGCGTGVPTIELAKISGGKITGFDIDTASLVLLRRKIRETGLTNKISVINSPLRKILFPEESFDIVWAEGSVFILGFRSSLRKWHPLLRPEGFLVIHDDIENKTAKLRFIRKGGYRLIDHFDLPASCWWNEYYKPLESLIDKFRTRFPDDPELYNELNKDKFEIDRGRKDPDRISSFYVIMQKNN